MISTICVPLVKAKKTIEVLTMHTGRLESYLLIQSGYNLLISAVEDWDTSFTTGNTGRVSRTTFAYIKLSLNFYYCKKSMQANSTVPLVKTKKKSPQDEQMYTWVRGCPDSVHQVYWKKTARFNITPLVLKFRPAPSCGQWRWRKKKTLDETSSGLHHP